MVTCEVQKPLPPSSTILYSTSLYISRRRSLPTSSAFVSCPEVERSRRHVGSSCVSRQCVCNICVSASIYCYPCTPSKTSSLAEETTVRIFANSRQFPIIYFLLSIIIPFKYAPRTRPQRPIVPTSCFFSSIKTSPEEWYQALSCLEMRHDRSVEMGQIICHVCLSPRLYRLRVLSWILLTALRSGWSNIWPYRYHQISYTTDWSFTFFVYPLLWNRSGW